MSVCQKTRKLAAVWAAVAIMSVSAAVASTLSAPAYAQLGFGEPANLSLSGSASSPVIGVAPNGAVHVLWWDAIDGTRYVRGVISDTATTWNKAVSVPTIVGERKTDANTKVTTIGPPRRLQMLVDSKGAAHATWFDSEDKLMYAQMVGAKWSAPQALSPKAAGVALTLDVSGTLHIAYVQTNSTPQSPAGMYYLSRAGNAFKRSLVYASTYFRAAAPEDINLTLARDAKNNVIVAWHAAREEQSVQTISNDGGAKWSVPEPITPRNQMFGLPVKVSVAAEGNGQFLMLWRDASASGCGLTQKRSTDAGATWSAPQRVLTNLISCPGVWSLVSDANAVLTLIGRASLEPAASDSAGIVAVWDGAAWAQPIDLEVAYKDPVTGNARTLGCISAAFLNGNIAIVGCDGRNDVWGVAQRLQAQTLIQTSRSPWGRPTRLGGLTVVGTSNAVSVAADPREDTHYAVWSQALTVGAPGASLNIAALKNNQWGEPVQLVKVEQDLEVNADTALAQTDQPSLDVGSDGKLHLVWSGGPAGRVFYMSAFAPDAFIPSRWTTPVPLPAPSLTGSDPSIAVDQTRAVIYVLYAVPFNEKRGVYLTRSNDGGTTWLTQTVVFDAQAAGWDAVDSARLLIDATDQMLHAVWVKAQLPGATSARALYYARSTDGGQTWSTPQLIDEGDIGAARIVNHQANNLMLTWTKRNANAPVPQAPFQVWWQASPEAGQRWTRPAAVAGFNAVSGNTGLATDGEGAVYLAALGRGLSGETTLLYTQWQGATWNPSEATSMGEPSALGNSVDVVLNDTTGQAVAVLNAAVTQPDGSRAFAAIGLNHQASDQTLAATPMPLPTFTPAAILTEPTPGPLPTSTPLPQVDLGNLNQTQNTSAAPNTLLISGILAAVVVIVGAIVASALMRRR